MTLHVEQIKTLTQAIGTDNPRYAEGQLESIIPDLISYLLQGGLEGWLV